MSDNSSDFQLHCPLPIRRYPRVMVAHGGGGRLMNDLIREMILPAFNNPILNQIADSASLRVPSGRLAFTTDSYVVQPLFFPGGDIGSLAVHGTVNDLAMIGARPLFLSAGFILEEGLPMETLWTVVQSMRRAAEKAGVTIVTGDTKVVDRGKGDGLFINTAGIGILEHSLDIAPSQVKQGDVLLVNGDLGRHGMAVLAAREGLEFETSIESDSAPLADLVLTLLREGIGIHCLRDLTRGGLASALVEIAEQARLALTIDEKTLPCHPDVRAICEVLGFDPLHVANEGRLVAFVPADQVDRALVLMKDHTEGQGAVQIGRVTGIDCRGQVTLRSLIGANRIVDMLSGEQLPRIC
ncbi:MAG: hydrogenase expression/formation protein HypE [Acidobacteria bacterium]|nr:MAG: hydrogenase expression/formation protein HypE [Acidobacteriota bacterium]